jgi:RNA polymerase sigma-70 factor (ECF subfamily)
LKWSERYLVWRLRRQDPDACRELVRCHHHVVFGHLRRLGADPALAEDLTQETYAKAWRRIGTLREAVSLRSWLLTIARNEFLQSVRARRPEVTGLDALPERVAEEPGPDTLVSTLERDEQLQQAVERLDPPLQQAVALHYFQDLSIREVAAVLGVPAGTVKSRLSRALETLRRLLPKEAMSHEREAIGRAAAREP